MPDNLSKTLKQCWLGSGVRSISLCVETLWGIILVSTPSAPANCGAEIRNLPVYGQQCSQQELLCVISTGRQGPIQGLVLLQDPPWKMWHHMVQWYQPLQRDGYQCRPMKKFEEAFIGLCWMIVWENCLVVSCSLPPNSYQVCVYHRMLFRRMNLNEED